MTKHFKTLDNCYLYYSVKAAENRQDEYLAYTQKKKNNTGSITLLPL